MSFEEGSKKWRIYKRLKTIYEKENTLLLLTAKQRRQTLEENAGRTLSLKMVASITRSTPKLHADAADWRICVRSNEEKSRILEDCHACRYNNYYGFGKMIIVGNRACMYVCL